MRIFTAIMLLSFISCTNEPRPEEEISDTEILLIDEKVVDEIKNKWDSLHIDSPKRDDYWTIERYFLLKEKIQNRIMYDSSGNIVGIARFKGNTHFYGAEYFDNGQQKGPLFTSEIYSRDSFFATYYHRNGKIRSRGLLVQDTTGITNWRHAGNWKSYDSSGRIIDVTTYKNGKEAGKIIYVHPKAYTGYD